MDKFPVHSLVWNNAHEDLRNLLAKKEVDIEAVDPRGRTPLHLAVTLGHLESVRVLLQHGANASTENSQYWTVVQESVATGDPEIVQLCLQHRDGQQYMQRAAAIPRLLQRLKESPDFYVEMKWEFTSWVPLVARMCPSDTYRVWKHGSNVRIDTTLLGFDNVSWKRGSRSFIFRGEVNEAVFLEVDHDARQVYTETVRVPPPNPDVTFPLPLEDAVAARLTSPIVTTYIDTDRITFERSKSGLWGWRSDKSETVNGHECKVFSASNVQLVTKTRTEHLTEQDKKRSKKNNRTPLESFLTAAEGAVSTPSGSEESVAAGYNPNQISTVQYFDRAVDLSGRDIGRPIEQAVKTQRFKAQLCLCESYPLSLPEQILPIIDLMAESNAHFRKLKDFITLQLPSGFPVKIEIPLFHVLNAKITFGNIFALDEPAVGVTRLSDADQMSCVVDESVFETPATYSMIGDVHHDRLRDEDDELLQFAIQQSLLESPSETDQVTLQQLLGRPKHRPARSHLVEEEDEMFQQAMAESMGLHGSMTNSNSVIVTSNDDDEYLAAVRLSEQEQQQAEQRRQQEDEELQKVLELSLIDK